MFTTPLVLYQTDYALWSQVMADRLRQRDWGVLDVENLAEEIESLGKRDRRELTSRIEVLILHLLKWQYQSQKRSPSWQSTIKEQRREVERILADSPSLKGYLTQEFPLLYQEGREMAADETLLPLTVFPATSEWTLEQVCDRTFWPSPTAD